MISDLDIWRSANLPIQQHGDQAEAEAAQRAGSMLKQGEKEGWRVWLRILEKVMEVQREEPSEGEPVH